MSAKHLVSSCEASVNSYWAVKHLESYLSIPRKHFCRRRQSFTCRHTLICDFVSSSSELCFIPATRFSFSSLRRTVRGAETPTLRLSHRRDAREAARHGHCEPGGAADRERASERGSDSILHRISRKLERSKLIRNPEQQQQRGWRGLRWWPTSKGQKHTALWLLLEDSLSTICSADYCGKDTESRC